jgi:hypothetical protein
MDTMRFSIVIAGEFEIVHSRLGQSAAYIEEILTFEFGCKGWLGLRWWEIENSVPHFVGSDASPMMRE